MIQGRMLRIAHGERMTPHDGLDRVEREHRIEDGGNRRKEDQPHRHESDEITEKTFVVVVHSHDLNMSGNRGCPYMRRVCRMNREK